MSLTSSMKKLLKRLSVFMFLLSRLSKRKSPTKNTKITTGHGPQGSKGSYFNHGKSAEKPVHHTADDAEVSYFSCDSHATVARQFPPPVQVGVSHRLGAFHLGSLGKGSSQSPTLTDRNQSFAISLDWHQSSRSGRCNVSLRR